MESGSNTRGGERKDAIGGKLRRVLGIVCGGACFPLGKGKKSSVSLA